MGAITSHPVLQSLIFPSPIIPSWKSSHLLLATASTQVNLARRKKWGGEQIQQPHDWNGRGKKKGKKKKIVSG
jgi:hypothetical protein